MNNGTMSISETLAHDFRALLGFAWKAFAVIVKAVLQILLYIALAAWFVINVILEIALVLTLRDCCQWFIGTNKANRR